MNFSVVVVERIHPLSPLIFFLFYASIVVEQKQEKRKKVHKGRKVEEVATKRERGYGR